jgi:hypothetical protein
VCGRLAMMDEQPLLCFELAGFGWLHWLACSHRATGADSCERLASTMACSSAMGQYRSAGTPGGCARAGPDPWYRTLCHDVLYRHRPPRDRAATEDVIQLSAAPASGTQLTLRCQTARRRRRAGPAEHCGRPQAGVH